MSVSGCAFVSVFVCLSASISLKINVRSSPNHCALCCGLLLLWQHRDPLCISDFMDGTCWTQAQKSMGSNRSRDAVG